MRPSPASAQQLQAQQEVEEEAVEASKAPRPEVGLEAALEEVHLEEVVPVARSTSPTSVPSCPRSC